MASKNDTATGKVIFVISVTIAVAVAYATNPFDESLFRILYSAAWGGLGGGVGNWIAKKLT